jgi:hypothetical protein
MIVPVGDAYAELGRRYQQIQRLSDVKLARDLLAREGELWPAVSRMVPAMDAWLASADSLEERLPAHRRTREQCSPPDRRAPRATGCRPAPPPGRGRCWTS